MIAINELIAVVGSAQRGCGEAVKVKGTCTCPVAGPRRPQPCAAGTVVRA